MVFGVNLGEWCKWVTRMYFYVLKGPIFHVKLDVQVFRYRQKIGGGSCVWQFTRDSAYAETVTVSLFGQLPPRLIYPFRKAISRIIITY